MCSLMPCKNNGQCVVNMTAPGYYQCDCKNGFYGDHCQFDPCLYSKCKNAAVCERLGADGLVVYKSDNVCVWYNSDRDITLTVFYPFTSCWLFVIQTPRVLLYVDQ